MKALADPTVCATASTLPTSWAALPPELQRPFWTVRDTAAATGLSVRTLHRLWADPRSKFPRKRHVLGRIVVDALAVLRFLER